MSSLRRAPGALARLTALAALLAVTACGGSDEVSTAAPAATTSPVPGLSPAPAPAEPVPEPEPAPRTVRLTGDGIDDGDGLVAFGDPYEQVRERLVAALGEPTEDSGETDPFSTYGTCPGSRLRALEFGGGALFLLFGDVIGPDLTLYQWALTSTGDADAEVPPASALVGDVATLEFGVGTSLGELRDGTAEGTLEVFDDEFGPTFRLQDQSSGFFGYLSSTDDAGTVRGVQAGEACGE